MSVARQPTMMIVYHTDSYLSTNMFSIKKKAELFEMGRRASLLFSRFFI